MKESEVAELCDLNYREALREQSRRSGGVVFEEDGALLLAGAHPNPMMSSAIRTDPGLDAERFLARADRFFADRQRGYTLATRDCADDRELAAVAESAGLVQLLSPPAMVVRERFDDRPPPEGIELHDVTGAERLADFAVVAARAWTTYGLPEEVPHTVFGNRQEFIAPHIPAVVAYDGDEPVAAALAVLSHGIAGIYWVSTVERARGRGLGETVTRAVTNMSFDRKARLVILQASPMGEPIYRRMGFEEVFRYAMLVRPDPAGTGSQAT